MIARKALIKDVRWKGWPLGHPYASQKHCGLSRGLLRCGLNQNLVNRFGGWLAEHGFEPMALRAEVG